MGAVVIWGKWVNEASFAGTSRRKAAARLDLSRIWWDRIDARVGDGAVVVL
jgi:hypothetical protein